MSIRSELTAGEHAHPFYNPLDDEVHRDPYPHYRRLRGAGAIVRNPEGSWVISGYHAAAAVLRDPRFVRGFSDHESNSWSASRGGPASPLVREMGRWMLYKDPPDHTRLRRLVTKAFNPRAVEETRRHITQIANQLIDRIEGSQITDVINDFAFPLPVAVIARVLGLRIDDPTQWREWTQSLTRALDPYQNPEEVRRAQLAVDELSRFLSSEVAARRKFPGNDVLSMLIRAEEAGDRLNDEELISTVNLLFIAGHETTVNLIGTGLLALLTHPAEMERLERHPVLLRSAIEELLRYDSPVQLTGRWARERVETAGVTVAAGDHVQLLIGAANRDPARFPDPDVLDVTRADVKHLSFGGGAHFCLGSMLARAEAQIAIGSLIRRFPGLRLATAQPDWRDHISVRGLRSLPCYTRGQP